MSENWAEKSREKRAKVIVDTFADNCSEDRLDQLEINILRALELESNQLKAEVVNREGEKQEMREVIDRLKAEVESYKRAKAENDERFQLEAGALRLDLERERAANAKLRAIVRQEEIDANTIEDRSQEAAHYNWLDDQNEKLLADNAKLREALEDELKGH